MIFVAAHERKGKSRPIFFHLLNIFCNRCIMSDHIFPVTFFSTSDIQTAVKKILCMGMTSEEDYESTHESSFLFYFLDS